MDSFSKRGRWSIVLSFLLMASAILSGCSGGGGNDAPVTTTGTGTGSALQLAEKISVVDAKSTSSGAAQLRIGKFKVAPSTVTAAGTDWTKDVTQVFVHERSEEAFGTINEILCAIGQTQYDEMVNKGDYKALIDNNLCSQKRDSAESAGQESTNQSSGSTAPDYETWTVNSARADSNTGTPQIVKVWVHEKERSEGGGHIEPAKVIEAKATITEGVSSTNPYGLFTMSFAAYPVLNGTKSSTAMFKGMLMSEKDATTGKILLKFVMDGGFTNPQTGVLEQSMSEKSVLDRAADGSTGSGSASHSFTSPQGTDSGSFNIAFNTANFLRQDTSVANGNKVCLDRTTFDETAWRYGLYDVNGARVTRNSGFPIKYNDGTKEYFGWAGYWGLWLPDSVTIADGATVKKQVFSATGSTETDYKLIRKGGKLKKHTQKMLTLADVKNIPLDYNEMSPTGPGTNYRVVWDGSAFNKVAQLDQSTHMWTDISPAVALNLTTLQWDELNFWSQSLGGQVRVKLNCGTTWPLSCSNTTSASNTSQVIFYAEDIVYPGDLGTTQVTLACYDDYNCLDPNAFATLIDTDTTNDNPYFTNQITIPTATITVDGGTGDWGSISPLVSDPQNDSSASYTGDDIKALYVAKDATNLYIRMDLWENANPNFWNFPSPNEGSYRFQIESNGSTYPLLGLGVAYCGSSVQPCYGQWSLGSNGSNGHAPASLEGPSFVGVSGSTIEIEIPLAEIGSPTVFKSITADANNCCVQDASGNWLPPTTLDVSEVLVKQDYTFDPTVNGMVLMSGTTPVVLTETINSQQYQWGVWSPPLFEPTPENLALLACDYDPNRICGWKAWSTLPVFYTWETGPNTWSQFTALTDASGPVKFDPPLQLTYTHSQLTSGKPDTKYNGVKFYLDYAGFGELHGIPGVCVDMDSGQPVSCGPDTRWVPEFMIPEGAEAVNGSATYYIKPLEKEQRMSKLPDPASCSALTLTNYTLPDISLWVDPALGTEPTITGAPAVVGGVVQ